MIRPALVLALLLIAAGAATALGQATDREARARCAQLLAYWDQFSGGKSEGDGGMEMVRKGAGFDCDNRRYASGIKAMEDLLRRKGFTVPPP